MKYYLIAGEASGDLHASNLMKELKAVDREADFRFYGGDLMQQVGGTLVKHYREMAYMGFIPVLMHLPAILRNMKECKHDLLDWHPDVVILVDYPGFNLDIAKFLKSRTSIPVHYYISPKIWAWKEYRIKNIRRDVDEMFSILPFEVDFYKKHKYKIHYVGNPCVDAVEQFKESEYGKETFSEFCNRNQLKEQPIIALLAGSRRQEIKDNLKLMIEGAKRFGDYQMVIAGAPNIEEEYYRRFIPIENIDKVKIVKEQTYRLLQQSSAALVTSGTATLETAIMNVPQVVCYYTPCGKFISMLRKQILKVKYISLVNLIVDREIVTELVADKMNAENVAHELELILPQGQKREEMLSDYKEMAEKLGTSGASKRAAEGIYNIIRL